MYPILFEFGVVTVFSLWFFVTIGFVAGSYVFIGLAKRNRAKLDIISDHSFFLFFCALIVSRIVFVIFNTDLYFYQFEFRNFLNLFAVWDKGLSFWGAILGWILGMFFVARKRNESPMKLLDIMAPAILFGLVLGNIGAFLDGINYGTPTSLPWGVVFRSANVKYVTAIHPTQIYGSIYTLLLAGGLYYLYKRLRGRLPGFISEIALLTFSLFRFFEEFARGDETIKIIGLRVPQMVAFLGVVTGIYLIYTRYTNKAGGDPERILKNFVFQHVLRFFSKKQKVPPQAVALIA